MSITLLDQSASTVLSGRATVEGVEANSVLPRYIFGHTTGNKPFTLNINTNTGTLVSMISTATDFTMTGGFVFGSNFYVVGYYSTPGGVQAGIYNTNTHVDILSGAQPGLSLDCTEDGIVLVHVDAGFDGETKLINVPLGTTEHFTLTAGVGVLSAYDPSFISIPRVVRNHVIIVSLLLPDTLEARLVAYNSQTNTITAFETPEDATGLVLLTRSSDKLFSFGTYVKGGNVVIVRWDLSDFSVTELNLDLTDQTYNIGGASYDGNLILPGDANFDYIADITDINTPQKVQRFQWTQQNPPPGIDPAFIGANNIFGNFFIEEIQDIETPGPVTLALFTIDSIFSGNSPYGGRTLPEFLRYRLLGYI